MAQRTCSIEGCERPHRARGYCTMHYHRWATGGDLNDPRPKYALSDVLDRIERYTDLSSPGGCWHWTRSVNDRGYGGAEDADGRTRGAHRVVYETLVGPIPEGMTLDHECHNEAAARGECAGGSLCLHRRCVNPDHLVPKPSNANTLGSPFSTASLHAAKTHCVHGHEFTEENTRRNDRGWRWCRACDRARPHRAKRKNR